MERERDSRRAEQRHGEFPLHGKSRYPLHSGNQSARRAGGVASRIRRLQILLELSGQAWLFGDGGVYERSTDQHFPRSRDRGA